MDVIFTNKMVKTSSPIIWKDENEILYVEINLSPNKKKRQNFGGR